LTNCIFIVNKIVNNSVGASVINIVDHSTLRAGNIQQHPATADSTAYQCTGAYCSGNGGRGIDAGYWGRADQ